MFTRQTWQGGWPRTGVSTWPSAGAAVEMGSDFKWDRRGNGMEVWPRVRAGEREWCSNRATSGKAKVGVGGRPPDRFRRIIGSVQSDTRGHGKAFVHCLWPVWSAGGPLLQLLIAGPFYFNVNKSFSMNTHVTLYKVKLFLSTTNF